MLRWTAAAALFVAGAEELHSGRAAERLHVSLSRAIRECELGLVLFVQTTRPDPEA